MNRFPKDDNVNAPDNNLYPERVQALNLFCIHLSKIKYYLSHSYAG